MAYIDEITSLKDQIGSRSRIQDVGYSKIAIAGMGGSGISGRITQEVYTKKPVQVVDDYRIPDFVDEDTLFLAVSYSGTTEEVLTSTALARERGARIATISSGGKLSTMGDENILVPKGLQPRAAVGYLLTPMLLSFGVSTEQQLERASALVEELDRDPSECVAHAEAISEGEHIPVIYGVPPFRSIAYRWKSEMNENAKIMAYSNHFPELNHVDTVALQQTYRKDIFYFLVFDSDYPEIRNREEITARIANVEFHKVKPKGDSLAEKIFYLLHYGDYVSYNIAKKRGANPEEVDLIQTLKKEIAKKQGGAAKA